MPELTERMKEVLRAFDIKGDYVEPMTPNEIGRACGFYHGHIPGRSRCAHNGRVMGPAQRVIFAITALKNRGLLRMTNRRDGLSGTAYTLTRRGLDTVFHL